MYQEQSPKNVVVGTVDWSEGHEVIVKVDGKTAASWAALGLYFYKDADNYVSVERKHRGGITRKVALVKEVYNESTKKDRLLKHGIKVEKIIMRMRVQ